MTTFGVNEVSAASSKMIWFAYTPACVADSPATTNANPSEGSDRNSSPPARSGWVAIGRRRSRDNRHSSCAQMPHRQSARNSKNWNTGRLTSAYQYFGATC